MHSSIKVELSITFCAIVIHIALNIGQLAGRLGSGQLGQLMAGWLNGAC